MEATLKRGKLLLILVCKGVLTIKSLNVIPLRRVSIPEHIGAESSKGLLSWLERSVIIENVVFFEWCKIFSTQRSAFVIASEFFM